MSEAKAPEISPEELLKHKKAAHDYYATAVQILETRVQFYHEEFHGVSGTIQFLRNCLMQVKADIEKSEPTPKAEPQKPFEIDLTHLEAKPDLKAVPSE